MRHIFSLILALPLFVITCLSYQPKAEAEPLYFTYLTKIPPAEQNQFEQFLSYVRPIWMKHKMKVLSRGRIVDAYGALEEGFAPSEFGLLKAASRTDFNAYLSDPEYQKIKNQRTDAVDYFFVLESRGGEEEGTDYLQKTPLVALLLNETIQPETANVSLQIDIAGSVKGAVPKSLLPMSQIRFHAVSFDDNPTAFFSGNAGAEILLIGENLLTK